MKIVRPTVLKFGGTSVEDARAFERVAQIIVSQKNTCPVVVVSAMGGVTDGLLSVLQKALDGNREGAARLLENHIDRYRGVVQTLLRAERAHMDSVIDEAQQAASAHLTSLTQRTASLAIVQDELVSHGEQLSARLLAAVLKENGLAAQYVDACQCILTNEDHGSAIPLEPETTQRTNAQLGPLLQNSQIPVLGGFIGSTRAGVTTTLGRGGSDYSASLVGATLHAHEIQIWTDVNGLLTADPRIVKNARTIPQLSYTEAAELAYFGAKVLHPKTIQPAIEQQIPVRICNSRAPGAEGTLVCFKSAVAPQTVKSIAHKTGITTLQITSARMLGAHGFLRALFEVFDRHRTVVDIVTTSEVSVSLSVDDARALPALLRDLESLGTVEVEKNRAIVCVVGEGMRTTPGVAARIFSTLRDINVSLISQGASSINLTFVIDEAHAEEAVRRLHKVFFEGDTAEAATTLGQAVRHVGREIS